MKVIRNFSHASLDLNTQSHYHRHSSKSNERETIKKSCQLDKHFSNTKALYTYGLGSKKKKGNIYKFFLLFQDCDRNKTFQFRFSLSFSSTPNDSFKVCSACIKFLHFSTMLVHSSKANCTNICILYKFGS